MNPWPVFENGPGGGTQRSHRSAECNPPIRTVSLDCLGEFLEAAATATFPSLFFTPYPAYSNQDRSMRSTSAHARIPQSLTTSLAGKVPGRFAGSDVTTFGRPPGDRLAGTVLLRLPGPLGSGVLACSTGLSACSGRHAMAPRPRRRATCSM